VIALSRQRYIMLLPGAAGYRFSPERNTSERRQNMLWDFRLNQLL